MRRNTLIISGILLFLLGGLVYWLYSGKDDRNQISVTVDNSLSVDKVKIEYGFHSINSGADQNLVKIGFDKVLFSGKSNGEFETICGENDFFVTYDNEYYTIVRHFIPNDFYDGVPKPHKYNFNFRKEADKIIMTLDIIGEDGEKHERQLVHVADANENIWGRPINKTTGKTSTEQ